MTSRAARRRRKRDLQDVPAIPRRAARGKARMAQIDKEPPEDASLPAIIARCRRAGITATEDAIRDMRDPWAGCEAGQAMAREVQGREARLALWSAIQHVRAAWARYARANGLPMRSAQCLRILRPVDAMQTDAASPATDPRTDAERSADALRSWRQAELLVGRYGRATAGITMRCVLDDTRCENATAMVLALRNVASAMTGAKCA